MRVLFTIDAESDLIAFGRLVNTFRRKGIGLDRMTLASASEAFRIVVLFEAPEAEIEHIFNFVRRTEGVRRVGYHRPGGPEDSVSFALVDIESERPGSDGWTQIFPHSKWVFASDGKALIEMGAEGPVSVSSSDRERSGFQPFTGVKSMNSYLTQED